MSERTLVLGGAVSGRAAARLAVKLGRDVVVYDRDAAALDGVDGDVVSGEWDRTLLDGVDLVVTSPGIPESAAAVVDSLASGAAVISELEFASRHLTSTYVAVTGTNGKTTVTETTAAMLTASGLRACAAGNVGLALSDVALDQWDCVAIEASSFQLRFIDRFHPAAAAILNVAPDHLDWHGDFERYAAAKGRIVENQVEDDIVAHDADDDIARELAAASSARVVPVSGLRRPPGGNGPDGTMLHVGGDVYTTPALDPVWIFSLTMAATLATATGATQSGVAAVIEDFTPGSHRRTVVANQAGVTWVDDSKATNPHAAVASASAYPSVVLIAGGRNKGLDLAPLVAVPSLRHVLAIGEAAGELSAAGGELVTVVESMESAVRAAADIAEPGDTVLLAPGCASFDMFESYGRRGEVFTELVLSELRRRREAT